jgi:thiol-disulfide isomerase/thioredoxin
MNLRSVIALVVFTASFAAMGDDEKFAVLTVGSATYSNVTVTSVSATDIYFSHSRGLGNAKLKNLSPDLQKLFHYDADKASTQEKERIESNAAYTAAAIAAKPVKVRTTEEEQVQAPPPAVTEGASSEGVPPHPVYARSFLNKPAPAIQTEKWLWGQPDTSGKFVLVDFWATWCGPCRKAIPELNVFSHQFKDKLVVIGLSDETEQAVQRMTQPKIDYYVAVDTQARSSRDVGVTGIPHALLIDPKGIVRFEGMPGYLTEQSLSRIIAKYGD